MGCLFTARLCAAGVTTTLVDYRPERMSRLQKTGIVVQSAQGEFTAKPSVAQRVPVGMDLVVVFVKSGTTNKLQFPENVPVLTLQNGLNNAEILSSKIGSARLMAGVTTEAATLLEEGKVRHAAAGKTVFGAWTSCNTQKAFSILTSAGFDVEVTDMPGQKIWEKTVINAGVNPLTALLNVPNGKLIEIREIRQLLRDLVVEAAKVAAVEGYRFEYSLVELAEEVCRDTAENISSMLQDVRAGRPTEIDAISGEIIHRAELASLPTPRTRIIWQLMKGIEQR